MLFYIDNQLRVMPTPASREVILWPADFLRYTVIRDYDRERLAEAKTEKRAAITK